LVTDKRHCLQQQSKTTTLTTTLTLSHTKTVSHDSVHQNKKSGKENFLNCDSVSFYFKTAYTVHYQQLKCNLNTHLKPHKSYKLQSTDQFHWQKYWTICSQTKTQYILTIGLGVMS